MTLAVKSRRNDFSLLRIVSAKALTILSNDKITVCNNYVFFCCELKVKAFNVDNSM